MALMALSRYTGSCVALIGEWDGDTGTTDFAEALWLGWALEDVIALPNWSDTAHDLTIWRRRETEPDSTQPLQLARWPACLATGAHSGCA